MDISLFFKTCVNAVALFNTRIQLSNNAHINGKNKKSNLFSTRTCRITKQIKKLYELLSDNHKANLKLWNNLFNEGVELDITLNQIDFIAPSIIKLCSKLVKDLKLDLAKCDFSQHYQEHQESVILMIEEYLQYVSNIYIEQKSMRLKKVIGLKKLSKLNFIQNNHKVITKNTEIHSCDLSKLDIVEVHNSDKKIKSLIIQEINGDMNQNYNLDEDLSQEDVQMFEVENDLIYHELNNISEEVKQIQSKVVHISELQELFIDRILDQDKNVENVLTTVVGSTENVVKANEHIRNAIQRNAGLRVWILFFLILMSFTLIFLDWYNP